MMRILKNFIKKIVFKFIKPEQYISNTYSQAGEDAVMQFLFNETGISKPTYLDIGTNKPVDGNNTYLLYQYGSRGVCVEADETYIPLIKKSRPEDKVLNCGVVVDSTKELDFYIFDEKSINTFDKEEAEKRQQLGTYKIVKVSKVKLLDINTIIRDNFSTYPHLLSLDIEGLDLKVLQSLDLKKYPIPVICTETCTYSENHIRPKDLSIQEFMLTVGYFVYADTYINTIFVNSNWFNSVKK